MRSCHCDSAEFVTCTMSHLCCVIQRPRCVACVSTTVQCLLRHRTCKHDLAMRVVVCMLLRRACVCLARNACLERARHNDAMPGGERFGAFRPCPCFVAVRRRLQQRFSRPCVLQQEVAIPQPPRPAKMLFDSFPGPATYALSQSPRPQQMLPHTIHPERSGEKGQHFVLLNGYEKAHE
jgi:hypothetical protein